MNRGFYPSGKGTGGKASGKAGRGGTGFRGKCMRCGKIGHKAMDCRQGRRPNDAANASNVGFVFSSWPEDIQATNLEASTGTVVPLVENGTTMRPPPSTTTEATDTVETAWVVTSAPGDEDHEKAFAVLKEQAGHRAILDSGASESIVGANTLQLIYDRLEQLGFDPDQEVAVDHSIHRSFVFGNDQTSAALGLAKVNMGVCGQESKLDVHVVEGSTPLLLSGRWLYDAGAVINFRTGRAKFLSLSDQEVQLERAPSFHLMMPVHAFKGNSEALSKLQVEGAADAGLPHVMDEGPCEDQRAEIPGIAKQP